jgi:hypothetical protein
VPRRKRAALVKFKGHCVDCPDGAPDRVVARPGPRCQEHRLARRKVTSEAAHAVRIKATYGITVEEYWAIYAAQGGKCYICERATGKTKRLAVDHDHVTGEVRGLLDSSCNIMLGHLRDDPAAFQRAIDYLTVPPARAVLERMRT